MIQKHNLGKKLNKNKKHNTNSSCDNQEQLNNVDKIDNGNKLENNSEENKIIKQNANIKKDKFRRYINEEIYPIERNHMGISSEDIDIADVLWDGNYLYLDLSKFLYGTENLHLKIRTDIYNSFLKRIDNLPDITINTENDLMRIREYINNIQNYII